MIYPQPCVLEACAFVMKIIGLEIYYVVRSAGRPGSVLTSVKFNMNYYQSYSVKTQNLISIFGLVSLANYFSALEVSHLQVTFQQSVGVCLKQ